MSKIENPSAFPSRLDDPLPGGGMYRNDRPGMSLRDWFAGQALVGFLADSSQRLVAAASEEDPKFRRLIPTRKAEAVNEQVALGCYQFADAMLAARQAQP